MKTAIVTLTAGEFAHSVAMTVQIGIVTDYHYNLTQVQAQEILWGLYLDMFDITYKGDEFIMKLLEI